MTLLQLSRREIKLAKRRLPATTALCRIFCRLQAEGRLAKSDNATAETVQVVDWLRERYGEYKKLLLRSLSDGSEAQQEQAFPLAMQLVREESSTSISSDPLGKGSFFTQVAATVLKTTECEATLGTLVQDYAQKFDDIRHALFGCISDILGQTQPDTTEAAISNCLTVMSQIDPPTAECTPTFYADHTNKAKPPKLSPTTHKKAAQKAWLSLLSRPLTNSQRKTLLNILTHRIVPWIINTEILMDFLSDAFSAGGSVSLLALSGLFHLMQTKNLDYPDFYTKLYSLLDDDLLYSKHRSRFFRLLNTFLSSTHLPAVMVASFIKKLSRLALHGPPAGIVAVVPWVYNMLKAHPTCTFMIHRVPRSASEREDLETHGLNDPFHASEPNPSNTNAIDSCLWELETLQSHYHPNVASLCRIISEQFTKASYNLEDFLDHSYASLFQAELGREVKKSVVVEFEIPKTVFVGEEGGTILQDLMTGILAGDGGA